MQSFWLLLFVKVFFKFIPCFSFLSYIRIFQIFSFITHTNNMCAEHENISIFLIKLLCVSSVIEFSKEQNKLSPSTIYHNQYCFKTFF